jgi:hypothetical protein
MVAVSLPVESPAAIVHLDEDWAIPCGRYPEHLPPPCDHPAEWIAWSVRCCPDRQAAVPLCAAHLDELLTGEEGICAHCGQTFAPTRAGFTLIEPLNRRTT